MVQCVWYTTPLLFATVVLADYYIDNANTSVTYSMAPSTSGVAWQTFSVGTQSLALSFSNSTGNYTIPLDASHCYNENYALGVCGTNDNCFVEMPFIGSGITMYVFNAGLSGMTASFSVDGGVAVSNSIQPPPAPTYQVSNVSLYDIQGLVSGIHTMKMTVLDWNGSPTSMKFDYARINETLVAVPTTSSTSSMASTSASQAPTQTPTSTLVSSNKTSLGATIGGVLGGLVFLTGLVFGLLRLRKRKTTPQNAPTPESRQPVNPFMSDLGSRATPSVSYPQQQSFLQQEAIPPLTRTAILRDALSAGNYLSSGSEQSPQSTTSGLSGAVLQPLRRRPSNEADTEPPIRPSSFHVADSGSSFWDPQMGPGYNLTAGQAEVIDRLRANNVPGETISHVIEGFVSSNLSADETGGPREVRSIFSAAPPSYQTRER